MFATPNRPRGGTVRFSLRCPRFCRLLLPIRQPSCANGNYWCRPACATATPRSVISLTASILNSHANFRLAMSSLQFLGHDPIFVSKKPAAGHGQKRPKSTLRRLSRLPTTDSHRGHRQSPSMCFLEAQWTLRPLVHAISMAVGSRGVGAHPAPRMQKRAAGPLAVWTRRMPQVRSGSFELASVCDASWTCIGSGPVRRFCCAAHCSKPTDDFQQSAKCFRRGL